MIEIELVIFFHLSLHGHDRVKFVLTVDGAKDPATSVNSNNSWWVSLQSLWSNYVNVVIFTLNDRMVTTVLDFGLCTRVGQGNGKEVGMAMYFTCLCRQQQVKKQQLFCNPGNSFSYSATIIGKRKKIRKRKKVFACPTLLRTKNGSHQGDSFFRHIVPMR